MSHNKAGATYIVRTWQVDLLQEQRSVEAQMADNVAATKESFRIIRQATKKGDVNAVTAMARDVVTKRESLSQLNESKSNLLSMDNVLSALLASAKTDGVLKKSDAAAEAMTRIARTPSLRRTASKLSRDMAQAGILSADIADLLSDE